MNRMAKVGIWLDAASAEQRWRYGQNVFGLYAEEVLGHAGVPFRRLSSAESLQSYAPDLLLIAQSGESDAALDALMAYAEQGGTLIAYGGLNRMAGRLGCREFACREAAYAELPSEGTAADGTRLRALSLRPWIALAASQELRAFGALRKSAPEGEPFAPAYFEFRVGHGKIIRWNVNIPETIVHMQQGSAPVVEDGIPAADGSGNLDEGILKADDRCELDWHLDRSVTETGMPYFAKPYADMWREALIGQVLREAAARGLTLPFIDYWPQGVGQIATISHDSDFNIEESAEATLNLLKECGIRSTWCMIEPGYQAPMYERIERDGHELAFHYNALDKEDGVWSREEFERQLAFIRTSTKSAIRTNKNHYTRFEGWGELFEWCEANGITADQTRGPSKKGNVGFLFGTCHPYHPIAWADARNRIYNVLEIGFLTQDLEHPSLADVSIIAPFLAEAKRVRGIAHFLFHQLHILQQPKVADAFRQVVRQAKAQGFTFWTSEEIVRWEKARRAADLNINDAGEAVGENIPDGAVVWAPAIGGEAHGTETKTLFGVPCRKLVLNCGLSTAI